jgi:hypothetical protein
MCFSFVIKLSLTLHVVSPWNSPCQKLISALDSQELPFFMKFRNSHNFSTYKKKQLKMHVYITDVSNDLPCFTHLYGLNRAYIEDIQKLKQFYLFFENWFFIWCQKYIKPTFRDQMDNFKPSLWRWVVPLMKFGSLLYSDVSFLFVWFPGVWILYADVSFLFVWFPSVRILYADASFLFGDFPATEFYMPTFRSSFW